MGVTVAGSSVLVSLLALVLASLLWRATQNRKVHRRLPPGPIGLPIIGNLLQFNPARPHPQVCLSVSSRYTRTRDSH